MTPKLDTHFTPVLDQIVADHDRETALVWGAIWRLSLKYGYSTARHDYMADMVGLGHRTFTRRLKILLEAGMVQDLDPDLKGGIHRYKTLRYVIFPGVSEVGQGDVTPEDPEGLGQSDLGLGQSDVPPGQSDLGTPVTVTEHEDISHDTSHEISHDMPAENAPQDPPPPPPRPDQVFFSDLAEACDWDLATITDEQRGQVQQAMGILRNRAGAQPADMARFREWWDKNDWRGKRGDSPRPDLVRSEWGRYMKWLKRCRANAAAEVQYRNARSEVSEDPVDPNLQKALDTWKNACEFLKGSLPRQTYGEYIAPLSVLDPNGKFRLGCDHEGVIEWLTHRLDRAVRSALHGAVGRPVDVEYVLLKSEG